MTSSPAAPAHAGATRHPDVPTRALLLFVPLTFAITWGITGLYIVWPRGAVAWFGEISGSHPLFFLATWGPAIAGLLVVVRYAGVPGLRGCLRRVLAWRSPPWWTLFVVVGVPLVFVAGSLIKGGGLVAPIVTRGAGVVAGAALLFLLLGPIEELGWRGVAQPILQRHVAPIWAGLLIGVTWGLWHLPAFYLSGTLQSGWSFTPFFVGNVALAVIVTPLLNATRGSLLWPMFFHWQLVNPVWPDAQPWDTWLFVLVALITIWLNRASMFTRAGAWVDVVPRRAPSAEPPAPPPPQGARSASGALLVLGLAVGAAGCGAPPDTVVDGTTRTMTEASLAALLDSAFSSTAAVPGAILRVEVPLVGLGEGPVGGAGDGASWEAAVGVLERGSAPRLRPDHTLRIASMTKTYVAAAVLRLVEEGRVALDEAVGPHLRRSTTRLLREGGYDPSRMTVAMLLHHTSGLPDYASADVFLERVLGDPSHRWTRDEQVRLAMDLSEPVGAPGQRFNYSDTGYILLGELIEVETGEPLPAALRRLLGFDRIGLTATWMEGAEGVPTDAPPRAHQYLDTLDTWGFDPSFDLFGGGGIVSNLRDVSVFTRALFEGGVFRDPGTLPRMLAVTPASVSATDGGYGMGLARVRYATVECFGHGGFWGTLVRYCPEIDLLVAGAVTSTSGRSMLDDLVRRTVALLAAEAAGGLDAPGSPPRDAQGLPLAAADVALVADLEGMIPERMRADQVPGLNVLILRGGEVVWQAPFGWADPADERLMALDAVFRVESISKSVTAWGVVKLAETGTLDLDAPVQSQLRRAVLAPGSPALSPRQLLSHTAGVGLGDYTARYAPGDDAIPPLDARLRAEIETIGVPGEGFSYSDTGYNLLEYLLQDRVGSDFAAWMDRSVLDPLGMADAAYEWDPAFRARMPVGHTLRGRPVEPYVYPGLGSGGLFATIGDVGRFVQAGAGHAPERVLADSSVALLHRPVVRTVGLFRVVAEGYGLGHFTETLSDGRSAVWHGGQGYGWMTHFHLVPETGDGIVLLSNSQRAWPLFGHILGAWSASLGVEPVRMSRVRWAAPLAWAFIGLCVLASAALVWRSMVGRERGGRAVKRSPPHRATRVLAALGGFGLLGSVAWASVQEYLFLFSILPSAAIWIGGAATLLGLALLGWAAQPGSSGTAGTVGRVRVPGLVALGLVAPGLSALGLAAGSVPVGAQPTGAEVVVEWMPASEVTRSLAGPAAEASVRTVRGSVLLPLVIRRGPLVLAPRIAAGRVGVAPRPIDPAEPVWVEALYDLDLEILADVAVSDRTRLSMVLAPGLASDLRGTASDHLTLQGTLLVTRGTPAGPRWGGGASFTNAFGEARVVPLLLLRWEGRGMRLDLLAPAEGRLFWAVCERVSVGVEGRVDGNVYGLGREGTLEGGRVRYSRADAGPAVHFDIGSRLRVSASAGISFRRRLEVEDAEGVRVEDAALASGGRMAFGLSWMLPEGAR